MAIYSLPQLERRGQLVVTAIITFFTYSIVYFAFAITQEGSIQEIEWKNFMWFAINGLFLTFSYSLIYIFFIVAATSTLILKKKVEPSPSTLSTQTSPCIRFTRRLEIASPRPVPPYFLVVEEST